MYSKIEISFQNSQFYRNYNEINYILSKFRTIRNKYTESKNKYKNKLNNVLSPLNKNKLQNKILEKTNLILFDKFDTTIFENKCNNYINETRLDSCRKILDEKIKISKDIKKYVKYSKNIYDDFIKSVKIGNIKNINTLIKNGADIHVDDDYALRWSSKNGHIEVVKFLIEKGANIHAKNDYALRCSSGNGHIEIVKFLIEKGANIHAKDDYAIRYSSENGHIEVVKLLVQNGANIHADDDYALRWSSENGHIEVVQFLIEKGANIHAEDDCALRFSSENGHIEVVKFLVEKGADIHAEDDHALTWSSVNGHIEIVKILLNSDLEYFSKNQTALNIVKEHKLIEFYEKFGIIVKNSQKIPKSKNDIMKYINSNDLESLKNCSKFDFSIDGYYYFFESLLLNNIEINQTIFGFIKDKEELRNEFNNICPFFDDETKDKFRVLFKNEKINELKKQLEKLKEEFIKLESQ
jgi:ankyrin repeat protein